MLITSNNSCSKTLAGASALLTKELINHRCQGQNEMLLYKDFTGNNKSKTNKSFLAEYFEI